MPINTVTIKSKYQVIIPPGLRKRAGVDVGDVMEAKAEPGKIVFTSKPVIDYSQFPNADDEYTPAQRRYIDARLAEARKGPFYGPFETHEAMIEFLHGEVKKRKTAKKNKHKV